jgi:dihydrofolate reductase
MHVFLIAALTADGFISPSEHQTSTAWTSKEDFQWFQKRTKEAGVVIMGSTTYKTVGKPLPSRLNIVYSRSAAAGEIPVKNEKAEVTPTELIYTNKNPKELLLELESKNYSEIAICGGSSIYTEFINQGLVDTMYLTIEPVVFGKGVGLFNKEVKKNIVLSSVEKLSEKTVLLTYSVEK